MKPHPHRFVVLGVLLASVLACSSFTGPTQAPAAGTPTRAATSTERAAPQGTDEPAPTDAPAARPTATEAPAPTTAPVEAALGDVLEAGGYSLAALRIEDPAEPGSLFQPQAGQRLVAVEVVIGNVDGEVFKSNAMDFTLLDAEGFTHEAELFALDEGPLTAVPLGHGERARGWVAFEVPDGVGLGKLRYRPGGSGGALLEIGLHERPEGQAALTGTARIPPELPPLGEAVEEGGYLLYATVVEDPTEGTVLYRPAPGRRLVGVEIVVGNNSGAELAANPLFAYLVDSEGFVYSIRLGARDGQLEPLALLPGDRTRGWVAFVLPDGAVPESVKYEFDLFTRLILQAGLRE